MTRIVCGWCGRPTADAQACGVCRHTGPRRPWEQRGAPVPVVEAHEGRPALTPEEARRRLAALPEGTDEALADHHGVDPRTVRRWRAKVSS